jgi:hypothetical protein
MVTVRNRNWPQREPRGLENAERLVKDEAKAEEAQQWKR